MNSSEIASCCSSSFTEDRIYNKPLNCFKLFECQGKTEPIKYNNNHNGGFELYSEAFLFMGPIYDTLFMSFEACFGGKLFIVSFGNCHYYQVTIVRWLQHLLRVLHHPNLCTLDTGTGHCTLAGPC